MVNDKPKTLRVIDVNDPVPHHFRGYTHFGAEVVFFNRTDYSYSEKPGIYKNKRKKDRLSKNSNGDNSANGGENNISSENLENRLSFNQMAHYCMLVKQKMRMTGNFRKSIMLPQSDLQQPNLVAVK